MAIGMVVFWCILLVNGVIERGTGNVYQTFPTGNNSQVPVSVSEGGPILHPTGGAIRTLGVPRKTVILSFDDGPDPTWTPKVLAVLRKHRVPATFFVLGSGVVRHPEIIRQMRDSGAEIGVHAFTHPELAKVPAWRFQMEISDTQLAIVGASGVTTSLTRPPYSSTNDAIDNARWPVYQRLAKEGYVTVLTTLDTEDWKRPGVEKIVRNAIPARGRGEVILMHDSGGDRSQTVAALDQLIPRLKAKGYRFATVAQVMGQRTANPPAAGAARWRGQGFVTAIGVARAFVVGFGVLLLVVGVLVIARLVLMLLIAYRHARRRKSRDWSWGPPVTEPATVIVPAYNEKENIADTLRSLAASTHPIEIIVVDDGSTDGTADIADSLGIPNVRVIRKVNGGKPSALNRGIEEASHDLIVMMDGDTIFAPDAVRELVQPFADPRVGAVAGNAKIGNRRGMIAHWQHIEYVIGFNIDRRVYDVLQCMPTVPGAIGAFRREALFQVGGVSDDTLAEDTDLTMAILRAGWKVVYQETAHAWTEAPTSANQLWRQRYRWSYGTMQSMWKHRRAVIERGPSGHFGRIGLANLALFQIALPLLSPLIDVFLVYGLLFESPVQTVAAWLGVLALQYIGAIYAFRLDRESLRPLWRLPFQQLFYRQLMYMVLIQSTITALGGVRLRWQKLNRTGGLTPQVGERPRVQGVEGVEGRVGAR